jgi:transglutaminase-like putative cysteine protease
MARQQDPSAGRQRLVALAAVAALCAVTALTFGRVFVGRVPTLQLLAASLASVAIAGLLERRGLLIALLASAVGLLFALTWIVVPQTAWYGLPTLRTLRALGRCLEFVTQQARVQVAPTLPFAPLMLAAVTASWTAAFSTHALAIRAGSPLLAILPSLALVGFADTVLEDGARPIYAVAFLLAALAVVFVDGLRRVRQWGPIWSPPRGHRLGAVAWRGARPVALVVLLAALLVPGLLPGFRSEALVDFSTNGADGVRLDPFVSIQAQLQRKDPVDLYEVTGTGRTAFSRLYSLDQFDGLTWSSSDPNAEGGQVLSLPTDLPQNVPVSSSAPTLTQRFRVLTDIDDQWLPMAYPPESVSGPFDTLRYDSELGTAFVEGGLDAGTEYSVVSRVVAPTPEELDLVRFEPAVRYGKYTFVPDTVDPRVKELAEKWAGDATTPYRRVLAIQDHFRDGSFHYDQDVDPVADADALLHFLTVSRTGFCQQFATSMAIMVRELGYPARVAVGYRDEIPEGDTYVVRSSDAHAWVEVFFPGTGWLPFEPTTGRSNPVGVAGTYLNPLPEQRDGPGQLPGGVDSALGGQAGEGACTTAEGGTLPPLLCRDAENAGRVRGAGGELPPGFLGGIDAPTETRSRDDHGYSIPYRWILLGLLAVAGVLVVVVPVVKWVARRRALRRSRAPRELVLSAYRVFDGRAADLGLGRREGETLEEYRDRISAGVTLSDGHLSRLTSAVARAAYAPEAPTEDEAREAVRDGRTAIGDLRRHAGLPRRIVGTYRPGI